MPCSTASASIPTRLEPRPLAGLSGGERGRVGLAQQLVAPADVLLLDEPTNHLDLETTRWLEEYLAGLDATVLLISHDRAFLQAVVDHVLHLEAGTADTYTGDYETFVRAASRAAADPAARLRQAIPGDRVGGGLHPPQHRGAEQRAGQGPPAAAGAGEPPERAGRRGGHHGAPARGRRPGRRPGRWCGDRFGSPSASGYCWIISRPAVRRGDVIGLIGPNGAGKTTLLRACVGERPPDGGEVRIPESVQLAHYRQDLAQVPSDRSLYELINDLRPSWGRGAIQGHLGRFGFSGDCVLRKAGTLSGGERARVALAMMMLSSGANLLLFDEPTNHLDVESIEALEDAIEAFEGTVILVSHDRALLRGAHHPGTWVLHEGRIIDFPGRLRGMGDGQCGAGARGAGGGRGGGVAPASARAEADPPERGQSQTGSVGPAGCPESGGRGGGAGERLRGAGGRDQIPAGRPRVVYHQGRRSRGSAAGPRARDCSGRSRFSLQGVGRSGLTAE